LIKGMALASGVTLFHSNRHCSHLLGNV
jgi:hypothetical protein